jgi:hypothetical protein
MRRLLLSWMAVSAIASFGSAAVVAACGSAADTSSADAGGSDASTKKDAAPVEPPEAGTYDGSPPPGPPPSCTKYCDLVMRSCTGENAQYASEQECMAFCKVLPLGNAGEQDTNSVACRQLYAGSPARTDAVKYCLAAGPFGGGVCDDRCTSFCQITLATCSPEAGAAPYPSYADCRTVCEAFAFRDGGADGGGEGIEGPTSGNTLNCRLYHLREAVAARQACADLGADSGACR